MSEQHVNAEKIETTPRDGGYDWTVENSRKLNEQIGRAAARAHRDRDRESVEAEAQRRGVTVEQVRLDRLPPFLRERMREIHGRQATEVLAGDAGDRAAERAADEAAGLREWRERKAEVQLSRFPAVYRDATPRLNRSREWIAEYLAGDRRTLVLLGEVGTGKTWEAYAILRILLVEHAVPASLVTTTDLMTMLRPNDDGQADLGLLKSAPVLVIDDLGAERLTGWGAEQFEAVANFRHDRNLPVIVTSNLTREQILERYDPRLVRRLFGSHPSVQLVQRPQRERSPWQV